MKEYKDKVAVITGAGRGIGRGIALRCAEEGMKIVLAGIGMESLSKTAADLNEMGAETLIVQTDVSLLEDVENLANKSYQVFGAVDLLVNNAGVYTRGSILEISMEDWEWVMGVNFYGVVHGVRSFIPRMIEQDRDCHVVNVSSVNGLLPGGRSYGISKHAVVVLSESLYFQLAEESPKVKISVYCPGWVDTEFDTVARSRPERFNKSLILPTETQSESFRKALSGGFSIQESANALFEGLKEDKLYIGPKAFYSQIPEDMENIRTRAENMINEINPASS